MAVSVLLANNIAFSTSWSFDGGGTPDAIAYAHAVQATSGAIDISTITVTGSTTGSATLAGGGVSVIKQFAGLANDIMAYIFYVTNATLSGFSGNITASVTYTSTTTTQDSCVAYALGVGSQHAVLDTSGGVSTSSAADPWAENTLTVAAGSVQLASYGGDTTSTGISVGNGTPASFTERRDAGITLVRFYSGDYAYAAGGSRGMIVNLAAADTGAIIVVSFKEGALSSGISIAWIKA